ncbi:hypothetical protein IG631_23588 [Alternaria alternata]|nr:hypothetical protein IG631_23588 [Alternaria alternata]
MVRALLGFSRSVEGHNHHHHHHHQDNETVLTFLVLAIQGYCQAGCKALHAKSYGTIRQSTGSPHPSLFPAPSLMAANCLRTQGIHLSVYIYCSVSPAERGAVA